MGLVPAIVGLAFGATVLSGPAPRVEPVEPCEGVSQWEADAQALADELAGASGADEEALRQELEDAGFVPGGTAPDAAAPSAPGTRGRPDVVAELVAAIVAALDTDGDGEVAVTVLGRSADATAGGDEQAPSPRSPASDCPPE